jgi:hypothetical protein
MRLDDRRSPVSKPVSSAAADHPAVCDMSSSRNVRNVRNKRTRRATVDDATLPAGQEWEVDFIVARASGKQGKKYLTRWKSFDSKADTWEPAENLAGAPDVVAKFNEEQDAKQAADLAAAKKKNEEAVAQQMQRDEVSHTR